MTLKFGKVELRGEHIVISAQEWVGESADAHRPITADKSPNTVPNPLSGWSTLATNYFKINVDAACASQQQRTGLSVVLRNDRGGLVCAMMDVIQGSLTAFAAEAHRPFF